MLLVGRGLEVRVLTRSLNEAASNKGGVVLLSGEPGIGKSSLLVELSARAEAEGFRTVRVRCAPRDLPGVESPWLRIIRDCSTTEFLDDFPLGPQSSGASLKEPGGTSADGSALLGGAYSEIEHLLRVTKPAPKLCLWMQELLKLASRPRPLLVTLDDLHHADEPSLDLLLFLTHALHDSPVLVAAAYRPLGICDRAQQPIGAIKKNAHNIEVTPLSEDATGELLSRILPRTPDPSLVRRVHDLTGGNPLFIVEGTFVGQQQDIAPSAESFGAKVPSTVRGIIQERLRTLAPEARKLLGAASAIGETFEPELAFRVLDFDREEAPSSLVELEGGGLIRPADGRCYRFVQEFVRLVAYEDFPTSEKASLHRRIATALEAQHAHETEAYIGEIARHLLKSRDVSAVEKALDYAEMAGGRCAQAGEFVAASSMYSIAMEAINLRCCPDPIRLCDILTALADAQKHAGNFRAAQETFCRAAETAQRLGDWQRVAQISSDIPEFHWPLPGSSNVVAALLADRALDSLAEEDLAQRALAMARLAAELSYVRNQRERSEELAAGAMKIAQRIASDRRVMLRVLHFRDCVLRRPELIRDRLANAAEMTRVARQIGDWDALFGGAVTRAVLLFQLGEIDGAEAEFGTVEQAAMIANRPSCHALLLAIRAARAVYDGRLAKSEDLFAECRTVATNQGLPELADRCWPAMIVPLRERGGLAELEAVGERTFMACPNSPVERAMACWLALELDKPLEARFHLERLAADDFADLKYADASFAGAAALTEVCARLGDVPDYAASLYEFLLPYANSNVVLGQFAGFGAVSYYLGKLAVALSRSSDAIAHFEAALDFNRRMGARTWTAYASVELARVLSVGKPDERTRAFELLRAANAEAESLGMERLARSTKEFLESNKIEQDRNGNTHTAAINITQLSSNGLASSTTEAPTESDAFPSPGQAVSRTSATFRREAEYWTVEYEGRLIRLKHLRGLMLIAHLLSRPHSAIHAVDLVALNDDGQVTAESAACKFEGSDLGPVLDDVAKRSYRERVQELREALEEARSCDDIERASKVEDELRSLSRELARAVGYGRDRKTGSRVERARLSVTNAIKLTIARVSKHDVRLGYYLKRTIRTGTFCCYAPDPDACVNWRLEPSPF